MYILSLFARSHVTNTKEAVGKLVQWPEHVREAERCDAQLNIPLYVRALRSVAHSQSKRSANIPLTLTGKPNHTQITLWHSFLFLFIMKLLNKCIN